MQQKNYFYYVILLLIPPAVVLKSRFVTRDNLYMIVPLAIAYLCYFFCLMLVLQIIYSSVRIFLSAVIPMIQKHVPFGWMG